MPILQKKQNSDAMPKKEPSGRLLREEECQVPHLSAQGASDVRSYYNIL